jgi:hypothetical protein
VLQNLHGLRSIANLFSDMSVVWVMTAGRPCVGVSIAALWEPSDCRLCFEAGESACGTPAIKRQPCCRGASCTWWSLSCCPWTSRCNLTALPLISLSTPPTPRQLCRKLNYRRHAAARTIQTWRRWGGFYLVGLCAGRCRGDSVPPPPVCCGGRCWQSHRVSASVSPRCGSSPTADSVSRLAKARVVHTSSSGNPAAEERVVSSDCSPALRGLAVGLSLSVGLTTALSPFLHAGASVAC